MSVTTFTDILKQVSKSRRALGDARKRTFAWYRENAKKIRMAAKAIDKSEINPAAIMKANVDRQAKSRTLAEAMIGKMLMFIYDPKHKKKLPYYDTFPLVFPINLYDDGFLGISLHYLPPNARAILMGHLYSTLTGEKDADKRLALSYQILNSAAKFKLFKPCIKRYLYGHVRSRFLVVDPKEWDAALMLPTAQFQKADEAKVWNDSMEPFR
jgi:hypothetical protein